MIVLVLPRVSSRFSDFPVASPCLWGKLHNQSFCYVANCKNRRKSRTKWSFWCSHVSRLESLWFSCGFAVSIGEAARPLLFEGFQGSCHVVLRGRRGTLWHSNLLDNVSKMSKLEEVSYEMLFFLHPRVLSRVAGFALASPCLWGKLQNLSFSKVSKQVVMSFCVAGVALCDISTCLITCGKYQNWRKSRTKCSLFLHPRVSSRVSGFPVASPCLWGKLRTPHSTLYTPQFTL